MPVQVITDSTSDIPKSAVDELGIQIVPIYVRFGDKVFRDGVDMNPGELYSLLETSEIHPTTSQPSPEDFSIAYNGISDRADGIVSIHISSKISGTYNSATVAKNAMDSAVPIEVVDSGLNSAGLGLVVQAAARIAKAGGTVTEVLDEAKKAISEVKMFGIFQTMKYLARGGRINKSIAAASHFLHVMPLLTFHDGEITRAGLVRSLSKGMDRLVEFVRKNLPITEIALVHSNVPDQADILKNRLGEFVKKEKISIGELGAGLGVHGGPGVLVVAVRKAEST